MKKSEILILLLILFSFISSIHFYPLMPDKIASHWNVKGEIDGYMSKFWGLFLIPLILSGIGLLFILIPRMDPLKANIEKFRKHYNVFIFLFLIFMLSIQFHLILWNLGIKISPNVIFPIELGVLFFYTGILCKNSKQNFFIGIRTPWTLSSEMVWEKTHKIGGKLFKITGIINITGIFFRKYILYFIFIPLILTLLYTIIYSYFEYQKEMKTQN